MRIFYDAVNRADAIVPCSPIYLDYISVQTKLFLDRLFACIGPNYSSTLKKGMKGVMSSRGAILIKVSTPM